MTKMTSQSQASSFSRERESTERRRYRQCWQQPLAVLAAVMSALWLAPTLLAQTTSSVSLTKIRTGGWTFNPIVADEP